MKIDPDAASALHGDLFDGMIRVGKIAVAIPVVVAGGLTIVKLADGPTEAELRAGTRATLI